MYWLSGTSGKDVTETIWNTRENSPEYTRTNGGASSQNYIHLPVLCTVQNGRLSE